MAVRWAAGTGDLIAALFLAWCHRMPEDPKSAAENAVATVQSVLQRTHAAGSKELLLVASRDVIDRPLVVCKAEAIGAD